MLDLSNHFFCDKLTYERPKKGNLKPIRMRAKAVQVTFGRNIWQQQGKRDEERQLLAEIYVWFTEGLDTIDLQEAKALLDELSD